MNSERYACHCCHCAGIKGIPSFNLIFYKIYYNFLNYVHTYLGGGLCMYECRCPQSPEEGPGSFEAGVTGSSELPSMSAVLNSGPLQELYMLITAEASLQTLDPIYLLTYFLVCVCVPVHGCMWSQTSIHFHHQVSVLAFPPCFR